MGGWVASVWVEDFGRFEFFGRFGVLGALVDEHCVRMDSVGA